MQPLLGNPKITIVFGSIMVDEADTSVKPNCLHVIWLAGGPHLEPLLQQSLYQKHIRPIVEKSVIGQPPATMKRDLLLLLVFHVNINETKRHTSNSIVGDHTPPTIQLQKLFQLLFVIHIGKDEPPIEVVKEIHQQLILARPPFNRSVFRQYGRKDHNYFKLFFCACKPAIFCLQYAIFP